MGLKLFCKLNLLFILILFTGCKEIYVDSNPQSAEIYWGTSPKSLRKYFFHKTPTLFVSQPFQKDTLYFQFRKEGYENSKIMIFPTDAVGDSMIYTTLSPIKDYKYTYYSKSLPTWIRVIFILLGIILNALGIWLLYNFILGDPYSGDDSISESTKRWSLFLIPGIILFISGSFPKFFIFSLPYLIVGTILIIIFRAIIISNSPQFNIAGKRCGACGSSVPLYSSTGGRCPSCGAYWGIEKKTYDGESPEDKKNRRKKIANVISVILISILFIFLIIS